MNALPTPVAGVEVQDILPSGFTYQATDSINASADSTRTVTANPAVGDSDPIWGTWTLPAYGSLSITFTAAIASSVGPATYQNAATAAAATPGVGIMPFDPLLTAAEDVTVLAPGTGLVTGIVYRDVNRNGNYDPSVGIPIPDVLVTLIDSTNTVYVAYTDANGFFRRVVAAGDTIIDVEDASLPAGLVLTTGNDGFDPTTVVVPNGDSANRNTGYVTATGTSGAITGQVWLDSDLDASKDAAESGMRAIQVILRDSNGLIVTTEYTDLSGHYSFPNVPVGSYSLDIVPAASYYATTGNDPAPVSVADGGSASVNFGLAIGRVLSGTVFRDNGSGGGTLGDSLQNGSEAGTDAGGLNVVVLDAAGKVLAVAAVPSNGTWSATVPTGSDYRAYLSTATPAVSTTIATPTASRPANWYITGENRSGIVDAPANGLLTSINANADVSGLNFGIDTLQTTFTVSGTVFLDLSGNGLYEGMETGTNAGGLYALLVNHAGILVARSTVAADGSWSFANVANGTYTVRLSTLPGLINAVAPAANLPTGWIDTGESADGITLDAAADGSLAITMVGAPQSGLALGVLRSADVQIQKTGPWTALQGSAVSYNIVVFNAGPADAGGTVVYDQAPAGATQMTWSCSGASGGAICPNPSGIGTLDETIATLPVGGRLVYQVNLHVPTIGTTVTNTAWATTPAGISDPQAGNSSASATTTLTLPSPQPSAPQPIPSLSAWGYLMLILILSWVGIAHLPRRG